MFKDWEIVSNHIIISKDFCTATRHGVQGLSLRNQTDLNGNTACVACQFSHGLFNLPIFGFLSTLKASPKPVSTWPQKHGLGWATGDVKRILNFIQVILLRTGDGDPPPQKNVGTFDLGGVQNVLSVYSEHRKCSTIDNCSLMDITQL